MKDTKIEWCHHTVNFWWGCSKVSEACQNCYAERNTKRFKKDCFGDSPRWLRLEAAFREIRSLNESAKSRGIIESVFINSMSDFFDERVLAEVRLMCWEHIRQASNLVFLVLTKRADVMANHLERWYNIPENVHFGITAENQTRLDERMKLLQNEKQRRFFISAEPLLGSLDISRYADDINWVICGGENAPISKCRMFTVWEATELRMQCKLYNIPFFFKQLGRKWEMIDSPERDRPTLTVKQFPEWHPKGGAK